LRPYWFVSIIIFIARTQRKVINIKSEKWWAEFIFLIEGHKFAGVEKKKLKII